MDGMSDWSDDDSKERELKKANEKYDKKEKELQEKGYGKLDILGKIGSRPDNIIR